MFKDESRHYSLRKLSVGLASVLIGISFASGNSHTVKADTVEDGSNGAQTVVQTTAKGNNAVVKDHDAAIKIDAKDGANTAAEANVESTPKEQSQTPEAVKKNSDAITQDIKQDAGNTKAKQQNAVAQGSDAVGDKALEANNSSVVQEDSSAKNNSLADKNNALKAKAEATKKAVAVVLRADSSETTLSLKGTNVIDPKTLKENKTETIVKADPARGIDPVKFASNGGFDPKIWGTMDTNEWQLDNDGNITGYTGDMSHIIIPNASDFAKDGKSYQQIGISSDEMKKLGSNVGSNANSKADTLAISLTDNKKVKATDTDWSNAFTRSTLKQANLEGLDTSNVTNMSYMFTWASSLKNLDVSKWNTGKVTNMIYMFDHANSLTSLDVSNWDTSNVADMHGMFYGARGLTNLDVSKWNTSKVTDMSEMFNDASSLKNLDVSKWNTGNVTDMGWMFYGASSLTDLNVSNWDTGNVTDMSYMFNGASSLTSLDVSKWDTGKVTNMCWMFRGASSLTSLDVSNWKTGNVTNMSLMFYYASSLTSLDVSNWDTSKVTNMSYMFNDASSLKNLDVSNWDTSKVTNMSYMFYDANSLTSLDVSNWDTGKVTDMSEMFGKMFDRASSLALIVNGDKFADYLVNNDRFAYSEIDSSVKSVTTDNTKLLQLLTNDIGESKSATRTIVFTFPTGYSPDLTKYHLTKNGNTYQIKQSADYDKSYIQGTVLINATGDITKHHIDTTKPYKLSDTWQPNYDKLVLAHKNADGTVSFDKVQLPKVPGYKAKVTRNNGLLTVSYLVFAPEKPATNNNLNELQFSNKLVTNSAVQFNSTVNSNIVVKSDMYQVVNDDHNWQLPVIKNYDLKFATNKNQIIFAYIKDKQYNYRFVLTFKDGQYRLATFNKQGKLLKTYSIKSYKKLVKIIHSLVSMNIA